MKLQLERGENPRSGGQIEILETLLPGNAILVIHILSSNIVFEYFRVSILGLFGLSISLSPRSEALRPVLTHFDPF